MSKTATKAKTTTKPKANSVTRTKGKAKPRSLKDIKAQSEDDDILAALDDEATNTADDILADIASAETIDKSDIYESQESKLSVDDTATKSSPPKKTKRKRKAADGTEKEIRARREIDMTKLAEIYQDAPKMVESITGLPKKVQDKAKNAMLAMTTGARLSQYTGYAVEALKIAEGGTIEVGTLRSILENRGYKQGTANAQAQQQMALLPFLGVAERNGRLLTLKEGDAFTALAALV
jgi:hypothetical protein